MKKIIIGITGLIGDGKTELANFIKKKGIKVINVDNFAHKLYKKGTRLYNKLLTIYGKKIVTNDKINREILSRIVFSNNSEYEKFTSLIYPELNFRLYRFIKQLKTKIIIVDMAVLFQSGFYKFVDKIILVKTNDNLWKKRFKSYKNFELMKKVRNFQKRYLKFKIVALSDYVLYNNYTKEKFIDKAKKIIKNILKEVSYGRKRK